MGVAGLDSFREKFRDYPDCYTIIGGTACDILMSKADMVFRATKDIDMRPISGLCKTVLGIHQRRTLPVRVEDERGCSFLSFYRSCTGLSQTDRTFFQTTGLSSEYE